MMPFWVGVALVTGTASTAGGALATSATYNSQVTGSPAQTSVEEQIYQVSGSISVTGPTGSISVTLPTLPGYVFNVYIGTSSTPTNLALSPSGPSSGPLAGQATQLASGSTVVLTSIPFLDSYSPTIGDDVEVRVRGTDLLVLGTTA